MTREENLSENAFFAGLYIAYRKYCLYNMLDAYEIREKIPHIKNKG